MNTKLTIGKKGAFQAERSVDLNPDPKVYQRWEIKEMAHGLQSVITKLAKGKSGFWKLKLNQLVEFQLTETSRKKRPVKFIGFADTEGRIGFFQFMDTETTYVEVDALTQGYQIV